MFRKFGVASFDSTSPLRQAFKDDRDNYYTMPRTYLAIRVPHLEANPKLQQRIRSGELNQEQVRSLESNCLKALKEFDHGLASLEETVEKVLAYERVHHPQENHAKDYQDVLTERPWVYCPCDICQQIGIQVILFRGTERNKRRGFHNLYIFYKKLQKELETISD
jgi:hypothetical protein